MDFITLPKSRLRQLIEAELLLELISGCEFDATGVVNEFLHEEGYKSWDDAINYLMSKEMN